MNDSKATDYTITGNTSVSISAPNSVTFTAPIYGSSASVQKLANAAVTGTSSVTIDGGTYTKGIYAAGYGAKAVVAGKATMTLKRGVFDGATLGVGASSATAGSSELVIAGAEAIDLSGATINSDFDALTLQGDVNLGTNRLPEATFTIEGEAMRTITLTVTDAEKADRRVALGLADAVPENLTVVAQDASGEALVGWRLQVSLGTLTYVPPAATQTWSTPAEGTAWADGLPNFLSGDNVVFGVNEAQESVTLPEEGVRVEDLSVQGSYAFTKTGEVLTATTVSIAAGGALALEVPISALRLTIPDPATDAIAELILTRDGKPVAWPTGTTIVQKNTDTSIADVLPNWSAGGNQTVNALIDGVYGMSEGYGTYVNPADGSTGTYTAVGKNNKWYPQKAGAYIVITLGEPTIFDGYILWTADTASRNPDSWKLEGSSDGTTWFTLDTRSSIVSPGTLAAYNAGKPFATSPAEALTVADSLTVAGTLSGTAGITAASVTFEAGSTLSGTPAITADTITFSEGSTISVDAFGVATLVGTVSGSAAITLAESATTPALAEPFPVLKAPAGLTLTPPEGYALATYANGYYRMYRMAPTWTAGESDNTWSNRERWTGLAEDEEIPTSGGVEVNFSSDATATLTIDTAVSLDSLLVRGSSAGVIEVGEGGSLATQALTMETDLTFPTTLLPAEPFLAAGKTLTLTGDGDLAIDFTSAISLVLANGTIKLADGVDLSALKGITIQSGATLDFTGKTFQSTPITLAGGTIANSSSTNALTGAVTLTADSFVATTGGEVHFNAANSNRKDLVLNGHKLTKTGSKLVISVGSDVDKGTIRVEEGSLRLASEGSDCTIENTTLSFAKGTSYNPKGWIRPKAGTVTLDADEGADVVFYSGSNQVHFYDEGRGCNIVKTGKGKITIPFRYEKDYGNSSTLWSGTTKVEAGTLDLYMCNTGDTVNGKNITVADGATLRKSGQAGKLTLNSQLQKGGGTIEVAAGEVVVTAANGNFSGSWKIAKGAKLSSSTGYRRYWQFTSGGEIEVNGELVFGYTGTNTYDGLACASKITGSGTVYINQTMMMWGAVTCTGKIIIASGKTLHGQKENQDVFLPISGADVVCNGTLEGTGASITLPAGKTLSGTGSIGGVVTLGDGAILDVSSATTNACLALTGTVATEGNVAVKLPSEPTAGLQLVQWAAAPEGATYTATTTLPVLAALRAKEAGLYYDVMSIDGGSAGSDSGTIASLSEAVQQSLAEAAFDAGATSISTVTGTQAGETLTATAIDSALTCFALTPDVEVVDGVATITISYDFGISGMSAVMEDGAPKVTVQAKVQKGEAAAALASGAEIILQSKDKDATDEDWAQVEGVTFEQDGDVYKATVSALDISNKVFRVLARTTE